MSQDPQKRNEDTRKASKDNIEPAPPVNKQDPTQPVEVSGEPSHAGKAKPAKAL